MRLWRNRGDGQCEEVAALEEIQDEGSGKALLTFDYDRDGDLDVFVVNTGGPARLFRNDAQNANSYLSLKLRGGMSNSFGWGARVRVTAAGKTQVAEVNGGSGFLSQSAAPLFLGLGQAERIDILEVRWPSGFTQTLRNVNVNQELEIRENSGPGALPAKNFFSASPNPFLQHSLLHFSVARNETQRLVIFNARGLRVRALHSGKIGVGTHILLWDGRDDRGQQVPAGVYFGRLVSPSRSQQVRLLRLR